MNNKTANNWFELYMNNGNLPSGSAPSSVKICLLQLEKNQQPTTKRYRADENTVIIVHQTHTQLAMQRRFQPSGSSKRKIHKCDQCDYSTTVKSNLNKHKYTHLPDDQRLKTYQCDHDRCDCNTHKKNHLKTHQKPHKRSNFYEPDVQILKEEPDHTFFSFRHRFDNQAPLWTAELSIKQEVLAQDTGQVILPH